MLRARWFLPNGQKIEAPSKCVLLSPSGNASSSDMFPRFLLPSTVRSSSDFSSPTNAGTVQRLQQRRVRTRCDFIFLSPAGNASPWSSFPRSLLSERSSFVSFESSPSFIVQRRKTAAGESDIFFEFFQRRNLGGNRCHSHTSDQLEAPLLFESAEGLGEAARKAAEFYSAAGDSSRNCGGRGASKGDRKFPLL